MCLGLVTLAGATGPCKSLIGAEELCFLSLVGMVVDAICRSLTHLLSVDKIQASTGLEKNLVCERRGRGIKKVDQARRKTKYLTPYLTYSSCLHMYYCLSTYLGR